MAATTSRNLENSGKAEWGYFRSNTTQLLVGFNNNNNNNNNNK